MLTVAKATFRESLRDRILVLAALFALLMPALSLLLGDLAPGQNLRLVIDFGLGAINALLILLAVLLGSRLVARDLEQRIIYSILSKPLTRSQYLFGKYLGAAAVLWLLLGILGFVFYLTLFVTAKLFVPIFLGPLVLFGLEAMVMLALTLLFTVVTAPLLAVIYAFGIFVVGHNLELIRSFAAKEGGASRYFAEFAYHALPNLETFNLKNQVIYGEALPFGQWLWALAYGVFLLAALLTLASMALRAKELP